MSTAKEISIENIKKHIDMWNNVLESSDDPLLIRVAERELARIDNLLEVLEE